MSRLVAILLVLALFGGVVGESLTARSEGWLLIVHYLCVFGVYLGLLMYCGFAALHSTQRIDSPQERSGWLIITLVMNVLGSCYYYCTRYQEFRGRGQGGLLGVKDLPENQFDLFSPHSSEDCRKKLLSDHFAGGSLWGGQPIRLHRADRSQIVLSSRRGFMRLNLRLEEDDAGSRLIGSFKDLRGVAMLFVFIPIILQYAVILAAIALAPDRISSFLGNSLSHGIIIVLAVGLAAYFTIRLSQDDRPCFRKFLADQLDASPVRQVT